MEESKEQPIGVDERWTVCAQPTRSMALNVHALLVLSQVEC